MATYNGEQYILEQLQSLADQTHLPLELVVGDDGSKDRTLEIIEKFRAYAPFPVRVHQNETNLGFARNFLATAKRCNGDWISFCDQDDVWLPKKLAEVSGAIKKVPNSCMVLQNAWLCNGDLSARGSKFPDRLTAGVHERASQYGFWVWLGCLQTVHRNVIELWDGGPLPANYFPGHPEYSHDKWTCMIANALGGIIVLDETVALYRRHEGALTGDYVRRSVAQRVAQARGVSSDHYDFLAEVAEDCADYMRRLGDRTDDSAWASAFLDGSKEFIRLAEVQRLRGRLYVAPRFRERLSVSLKIALGGGYIGPPFRSMGLRSAAKDAARLITGTR